MHFGKGASSCWGPGVTGSNVNRGGKVVSGVQENRPRHSELEGGGLLLIAGIGTRREGERSGGVQASAFGRCLGK